MHRFICIASLLIAASSFSWAQSSSASPAPTAPVVATSTELLADARLGGEIIVKATWARLDWLTNAIAKETNVAVMAAPEVAGRRINLFTFAPRASAARDMTIIARLTGLQWEKVEADGKIGYRLFRSDEQRKRDEKVVRNSEQREEAARRAGEAAVLQTLNQEIERCKNSDEAGFGSYLAAFSPHELAQAAATAQDRVQIISAGDQRHLFPFFVAGRGWNELPAETQEAFRQLTNRVEYTPANPNGQYAPAAESDDALRGSRFGLVANGGQVQLALYNPAAGDIWVSPFEKISPPLTNSPDTENDLDPEVARQIDSPKLVTGLPPALAARKIKIPAAVNRTKLSALLEFFAKEVHLASASESWLRTATAPSYASRLLPAGDTHTVGDALKQIARTFGQRMVYENGVLYVTTLTRGRDLRAEMPPDLWLSLAAKDKLPADERKGQELLTLDEFVQIAALSPLQLETLFDRYPEDLRFLWGMFFATHDRYTLTHLYALLTPEQRKEAETPDGLDLSNLRGEAGRWHRATGERGLTWIEKTDKPLPTKGIKPQHLYITRESDHYQFLMTRRQAPPLRWPLYLPRAMPPSASSTP